MSVKVVRAKCGCEGCLFEDDPDCPGKKENNFEACTTANGESGIIVKEEDNNESRV